MSTRTAPGRRARANPGRAALLGVMLIVLTAAMLTVAGTTPNGIGRPVDDPGRVALDARTFSCPGGLPGTVARSGNVVTGLVEDAPVGADPVTVTTDGDVARGAFAAQQARGPKSLAWTPCPEPRARWWFVGAGGAAVSHDTVLSVTNPRAGAAVVDIDVYGPAGSVQAPGLHGVTVAPGATRVFDLARTAPAVGNLAVSVRATRGLVAVSAVDRFALGGVGSEVAEWLPAQSLPATSVVLAGLPPRPSNARLLIVNPGDVDAIAEVRVIGETGTFAPKTVLPVTIAPQSVASVPLTGVLDGTPMAVRLTSSRPLTATVRSVASGDTAFATGVRVIRGGTALAVPDGSGRLVLSSLGSAAGVRVVTYDARGRSLSDAVVAVPAAASVAVRIGAQVRYLRLVADAPEVVGGIAVAGTRGWAAAGVQPAVRSVRLPSVRSGW